MGRRPLAVGSYGNISYRTLGPRKVRAMCKVCDADGRIRQVTHEGTSKTDARTNLIAKIAERPGFSGSQITAESTVEETAAAWLTEVERLVEGGRRAPNTARIYRGAVDNHISPAVGGLRLREATVPRLEVFLVGMREHNDYAITKTTRTVLNGIMGYAVRQGAIERNPVRELSPIMGGTKRAARALTSTERDEWLAEMESDGIAAARELPDITRWMLATGCRIGEVLATTFDDIDIDAKTVAVDWTITRVKGKGLVRGPTKTAAGERTLGLPGWAVDMVIRRGDRLGWTGPLFPVPRRRKGEHRWPRGVWRDPSNTLRDLKEARDRAGYGWVTSHVFRKTVATVLHESGLVKREIADQLGHSNLRTVDTYIGRTDVVNNGALLEDMFGDD
jgi:integrase